MKPLLSAGMLALTVLSAGCGEGPAFGFGGKDRPAPDQRAIDTTGHDQPATLTTAEDAARATVALVGVVGATAELSSELGHAAGDLFPSKDNPCPAGGDASSDISGSINHPRIRMEFHDCQREQGLLDGVATITCQDLDGSECVRADVVIGEGDAVLLFEPAAAEPPRVLLMRGFAAVESRESIGWLRVVANLTGELRALEGPARWSFVTESLLVDLQDLESGGTQAWVTGVTAFGGGAQAANCSSGRIDNETPEAPLLVDDHVVQGGYLRMHSPPPRPGAQQAGATFSPESVTVQGADGTTRTYAPAELAPYCTLQ